MNRRYILVFCLAMLYAALLPAQEASVIRRISSADGLSNDFVLNLAIDGQGYVWVATEAGANRIAGKTCQPFPQTEHVSGQLISALFWDATTRQMLIGSETGLNIYNPAEGQLRHLSTNDGLVPSSINDITKTEDGVLLIFGTGQVLKLDCKTLKIEEIPVNHKYQTRCGFDDGKGHLYLGHNRHGLSIVNKKDGSSVNYQHHKNDEQSLPGNNVRCIYQDREHRIWVGTDMGLALFHQETGTFSRVKHAIDDFIDNVYDIYQMEDGKLWVATDIGGIQVLDPLHNTLCYDTVQVALSSLNPRSVVQDEYGNIWVGNHSTGVDFISARKPDFQAFGINHAINAITEDNDGMSLWMAYETGLTQWTKGKTTWEWSRQPKSRRKYTSPRCMMMDSKGTLWIGLDDRGAFRMDKKTSRFEEIPITPEYSDIHSFAEDRDGRIWIGGEFGVYLYQDGQVKRHEAISKTLHSPATYFLQTTPYELFIATLGDGIYSFNLQTKTSRHMNVQDGLPSSKVNQVIKDRRKGLWLGTDGGLVYLEDPVNLKGLSVYGKEQGLADNHILALQEDTDGRIWTSTYSGISCFAESTGRFYNYSQQDTRQRGGFAKGSACTDGDGYIYFGSASGVYYFHPEQIDGQTKVSDVQIVLCEAYNPVGSNTERIQLTPDADGCVHTTYRQNTLLLAFTVRDYAQTDHVEYSYKMKGMDDKWYDIGNDHDVVFRGLRPGHYTFILRAKLRSQDWEDAKKTQFTIYIAPPFWRTWWAYLFYALVLCILAWYLVRSYKRKLKLRNALELERRNSVQKQELNEERLRFFTNITHELRTPLTLILGPLDDLMDDQQLSQQAKHRVTMIHKSADRLKTLIGEILEFRKTETQNRRLTVARGDIGLFVREICLNFKELNHNPQVKFTLSIEDGLPEIYFDSEIITIILNNFLSNAIKYTEKGCITTKLQKENGRVLITVADTGYGIAPDALPHIFERYYQAKGSHQASGTGIGLALVKSLADLHEAQLHVESEEGHGSRFILILSASNTYPNALHKEDIKEPEGNTSSKRETGETPQTTDDEQPTLLVVEDNADIRQYIADSFSDDFHILKAQNGEEGVRIAQEHIPDIIVSDIMMPRLNGIQLTRQLKEDIRTSHIPIILLTAKTTDEDKEEGYDSGADSYLTKPFTAKLLASRIQNLLTTRRRLAEYITRHPSAAETPSTAQPTPTLNRLDREFIDKLNCIIRDNIMSQDIDLPFVTDKMAMSHSTFYRKVKALTGMTAKEYIRKMRLQHCYQLLESGDYNVSEAAMMTGFKQMAHFRETFKAEFGILPSEVNKIKK